MFARRLSAMPLLQNIYSDVIGGFLGMTVALAAVFLAVGCAPKSDLLEVTGEVALNGVPVKSGSIRFTSVGADKVSSTGAVIRDGKYAIPQIRGLLPGTYQIVISAADESAPKVIARDSLGRPQLEVSQELIPAEYNSNSQKTVEITVEQDNHFVFDIRK